jgi:hypothetical protein
MPLLIIYHQTSDFRHPNHRLFPAKAKMIRYFYYHRRRHLFVVDWFVVVAVADLPVVVLGCFFAVAASWSGCYFDAATVDFDYYYAVIAANQLICFALPVVCCFHPAAVSPANHYF